MFEVKGKLFTLFLNEQKITEMEKRKTIRIQKQKEIEKQQLLDELNKRQLNIVGKKSNNYCKLQYLTYYKISITAMLI